MSTTGVIQGAGTGAAAGSVAGPYGAAIGGIVGGIAGGFEKDPEDPLHRAMRFYYRQIYGTRGDNGLLAALQRQKQAYMRDYNLKYRMGVIDRYGKGEMAREASNAAASGIGTSTSRFVTQRGVGRDVMDAKREAIIRMLDTRQGFNDQARELQLYGARAMFGGAGASGQFGLAQQQRQDASMAGLGQLLGMYNYQNGPIGPNNSQSAQDQMMYDMWLRGGNRGGGGGWGAGSPDYGSYTPQY